MNPVVWSDLTDDYKSVCAELIGMIDSGERWIFEHSDRDSDFKGLICNKMLKADSELGILSACYYRNGLRICIAFERDIPDLAEKETVALLREIVKSTELDSFIWCRNENEKLRKLISNEFKVPLNYASREMSVAKNEFLEWGTPTLPQGFTLNGYNIARHESYINLLERAMSHITRPNTTPYLDRSEHLKERFISLDKENRFHALWYSEAPVGICFSCGGEIDTLAVDENYRRQGLGYYLLFVALQNAFLYREGDMCLYVVDRNPNAYEFYMRTGMRVTGHSARYYISRSEVN